MNITRKLTSVLTIAVAAVGIFAGVASADALEDIKSGERSMSVFSPISRRFRPRAPI